MGIQRVGGCTNIRHGLDDLKKRQILSLPEFISMIV